MPWRIFGGVYSKVNHTSNKFSFPLFPFVSERRPCLPVPEMDLLPSEQPLFLTWDPALPPACAEQAAQILFEGSDFQVPALYFGLSPVLGVYASGRTTGFSLHSGAQYTHASAIYEVFHLPINDAFEYSLSYCRVLTVMVSIVVDIIVILLLELLSTCLYL